MQRYSVKKKKKCSKKDTYNTKSNSTIVIENSDELTIGWTRSEVMIQYRSLAVPPYIIKIYTIFISVTNAFNVYIYIPICPHALNVFSPHVRLVHVLDPLACFVYIHVIYIRTYIYIYVCTNTCAKHMCKPIITPPRLELRHYRCEPKNKEEKKRSSRRRSLTMNTRLCLFLPVAPL